MMTADSGWLLALLPLGGWELAVVAVVALFLLFAKRLPELGRSLGRSITEFKRGLSGGDEQAQLPSDSGSESESETDKSGQG